MTTQELHIGIDIELQKINNFVTKNILPQEKDWFINKEVLKFINKKSNKDSNVQKDGFQDTVKRVQDIKELISTTSRMAIKKETGGKCTVNLPSDFFSYVRSNVTMAKSCIKPPINRTRKQYRIDIPINVNIDLLNNFRIDITVDEGLKNVFNTTLDIPADYYKSLNFKKQQFLLIKALQIKLKTNIAKFITTPFDLYWEFGPEGYIPNTFILISSQRTYNAVTTVNTTTTAFSTKETNIEIIDDTKYPILSKVRLIDDEFWDDVTQSHLSKSTIISPVLRMQQQQIEIAQPKDAILGSFELTYIRKPQLADLLLNSNVDLSRNNLDEIIVNTVAYIKAVITSQNYNVYKQENILIE